MRSFLFLTVCKFYIILITVQPPNAVGGGSVVANFSARANATLLGLDDPSPRRPGPTAATAAAASTLSSTRPHTSSQETSTPVTIRRRTTTSSSTTTTTASAFLATNASFGTTITAASTTSTRTSTTTSISGAPRTSSVQGLEELATLKDTRRQVIAHDYNDTSTSWPTTSPTTQPLLSSSSPSIQLTLPISQLLDNPPLRNSPPPAASIQPAASPAPLVRSRRSSSSSRRRFQMQQQQRRQQVVDYDDQASDDDQDDEDDDEDKDKPPNVPSTPSPLPTKTLKFGAKGPRNIENIRHHKSRKSFFRTTHPHAAVPVVPSTTPITSIVPETVDLPERRRILRVKTLDASKSSNEFETPKDQGSFRWHDNYKNSDDEFSSANSNNNNSNEQNPGNKSSKGGGERLGRPIAGGSSGFRRNDKIIWRNTSRESESGEDQEEKSFVADYYEESGQQLGQEDGGFKGETVEQVENQDEYLADAPYNFNLEESVGGGVGREEKLGSFQPVVSERNKSFSEKSSASSSSTNILTTLAPAKQRKKGGGGRGRKKGGSKLKPGLGVPDGDDGQTTTKAKNTTTVPPIINNIKIPQHLHTTALPRPQRPTSSFGHLVTPTMPLAPTSAPTKRPSSMSSVRQLKQLLAKSKKDPDQLKTPHLMVPGDPNPEPQVPFPFFPSSPTSSNETFVLMGKPDIAADDDASALLGYDETAGDSSAESIITSELTGNTTSTMVLPAGTSTNANDTSALTPGLDQDHYAKIQAILTLVENLTMLGANCTAGTAFTLGEGVVDRYAHERFRLEADVAVNRANMLTRLYKYAPEVVESSEYLLRASVLSMVEFDDDIFAAGHCHDKQQYKNYSLFCPFAVRENGTIHVKDLAIEYKYLSNDSEFFFIAKRNAERVINNAKQYRFGAHSYAYNESVHKSDKVDDVILSVTYDDGKWSKPYFDCGGGNIWMMTYTVPFFGFRDGQYFFKGTSGIDIDLRRVDIDQCPLRENSTELNIFAASDKCKKSTTKCSAIKGLGFRRGSYKCECLPGYYFPNVSSSIKYFNGSLIEEEYEKKLKNEVSVYDLKGAFECLQCPVGCDTCVDDSPCVVSLNWLMRTGILILQCGIIGMLPLVGLFTWKYSDLKVVRAASPVLLRFIVLGAFFIYCTILVMYPSPSMFTCTLRIWLREIGFSLAYGALMLKTWRISVIFRVRSAKAIKITDLDLMKRLGMIVAIFTALLMIRTLVDPPTPIVSYTANNLKAWLCKSGWWDHCFTMMELSFLVWGICLCIVVRKAPSEFNESKFISLAIYNEFLLSVFLNISMFFLQSPANPDLLYIIFFCHVQLTMTLLLCLIFGSKAYMVFRGQGKGSSSDEPRVPTFISKNRSGQKAKTQSGHNSITGLHSSTTSTSQAHDPNFNFRLSEDVQEEFRRLYLQLEELKDRNLRVGNRHLVAKIAAMQEAAENLANAPVKNCADNNGRQERVNVIDLGGSSGLSNIKEVEESSVQGVSIGGAKFTGSSSYHSHRQQQQQQQQQKTSFFTRVRNAERFFPFRRKSLQETCKSKASFVPEFGSSNTSAVVASAVLSPASSLRRKESVKLSKTDGSAGAILADSGVYIGEIKAEPCPLRPSPPNNNETYQPQGNSETPSQRDRRGSAATNSKDLVVTSCAQVHAVVEREKSKMAAVPVTMNLEDAQRDEQQEGGQEKVEPDLPKSPERCRKRKQKKTKEIATDIDQSPRGGGEDQGHKSGGKKCESIPMMVISREKHMSSTSSDPSSSINPLAVSQPAPTTASSSEPTSSSPSDSTKNDNLVLSASNRAGSAFKSKKSGTKHNAAKIKNHVDDDNTSSTPSQVVLDLDDKSRFTEEVSV